MFKVWESIRAINLAAGNVHFISYISDGYYSYRTEYKASLQQILTYFKIVNRYTNNGVYDNRHRPCKLKTYNVIYK